MFLILEIRGDAPSAGGIIRRAIFPRAGGLIGRHAACDWVLPDPHVSGRHARVLAVGRTFFIIDTDSGNGVTVNDTPLYPGELYPLEHGDRLCIDPFEIDVRIERSP